MSKLRQNSLSTQTLLRQKTPNRFLQKKLRGEKCVKALAAACSRVHLPPLLTNVDLADTGIQHIQKVKKYDVGKSVKVGAGKKISVSRNGAGNQNFSSSLASSCKHQQTY